MNAYIYLYIFLHGYRYLYVFWKKKKVHISLHQNVLAMTGTELTSSVLLLAV